MFLLDFKVAILVFVLIFNLLLAFIVYSGKKNNINSKLFVALSLVTSVWVLAMFFSSMDLDSNLILFWVRLSIFLAIPQIFLFYLLSISLSHEKINPNRLDISILLVVGLLMMGLTMTKYVFSDIEVSYLSVKPIVGKGIFLFLFYNLFLSISAVARLIKNGISLRDKVRSRQIFFVLFGILLLVGLVVSTILLPVVFYGDSSFVQFTSIYVFVFLGIMAIAILKYRLFDIRLIATELLIIILIAAILIEGMMSGSIIQILFKIGFACLVAVIGLLLVRSVKKEISQKRQLEKMTRFLEKANLRLKDLDQQKTEFLSIASHQLRTPISIVKGYMELIEDGAYGKPTIQMINIFSNINESNERLIKLVDSFLDVTRIEQGRTKFVFEKSSLSDLITDVVKELKEKADEKKMKIVWKAPKRSMVINMDSEKIRHVVFNFIDNAIKYSQDGKVEVLLKPSKGGLELRVIDNGIGFGEEDQVNFFQKFYRGKNVEGKNVTGTGLGIYVCKKFIENHKGRVWAKSAGLEKGSEFGFYIPY